MDYRLKKLLKINLAGLIWNDIWPMEILACVCMYMFIPKVVCKHKAISCHSSEEVSLKLKCNCRNLIKAKEEVN